MKLFLFLFPFLVLIGVGSIFPVFKAEPYPLPSKMILHYQRTGGPLNYYDQVSIDKDGVIYQGNSSVGSLSINDILDLTLFLDANTFTSLRESYYEKYKRSQKNYNAENKLSINLTVRSELGIIRIIPNNFINRILKPYIADSRAIE